MAMLSTPERRTPHTEDRTPMTAASTSRSLQNISSPSSSRSQANIAQLTVEAVLAAANGDTALALETVISERNMLSSQNTQLWKLIEKQRAVHGNAIKELERVRADRDRLFVKLDPDRASRRPNAHRSSSSSTTTLSASTRMTESPSPASERPNGHRFPMIRHQSDDVSLSSPRAAATSFPILATSRSHEPLRPSTQEVSISGSSTMDVLATPLTNRSPSRTEFTPSPTVPSPIRADSLPLPPVSVPINGTIQPLSVHKLHPPSSAATMPVPTTFSAPPEGPTVPPPKRQSSLQHPVSQPIVSQPFALSVPFEHNRALARESRITLPDEARRYIANMQESPIPSPSPRQAVFSNGRINGQIAEEPSSFSGEDHMQSPESKGLGIYDAKHVSTRPARSSSESNGASPVQVLSVPSADPTDKSSAFLDLDDDDDDDSVDAPSDGPDTAVPPFSPTDSTFGMRSTTSVTQQQNQPPPSVVAGVLQTQPLEGTSHRPHPTVATQLFDPPSSHDHLPPSGSDADSRSVSTISPTSPETSRSTPPSTRSQNTSSPVMTRTQGPSFTQAQVQAQRAYAQAQQQEQAAHAQQQELAAQTQQQEQAAQSQHQELAAHMRSQSNPLPPGAGPIFGNPNGKARLMESDLQSCRVRVVGSNIRANERGKEVLSFVVQVSPSGSPDAADSWKVEKLYSDVLGLDTRVRAKLSRSNLKKLGSLPDNKLFKDHAPAKVDQRKSILENYFQTVVRAPLKDRKDVCDFFSSDVINDASAPVTQSGYKEGYLTKRGKNFGGWKTRYFVLQGPVLEYYENRGGTHLGSINITGAQIGRQQKASTSGSSEDENEYRHAFLIIESRRGAGVQHTRHVLCAESDQERDSWVDVLVRYVMGSYDDTGATAPASTSAVVTSTPAQPRPSTSSLISIDATPTKRMTKADIAKGTAVPISQLAQDPSNAKLFQSAPVPDPSSSTTTSPLDRYPPPLGLDRNLQTLSEVPLSSSLPTHLDVGGHGGLLSQRAASELGHYPDMSMRDTRSPSAYLEPRGPSSQRMDRVAARSSVHPSLSTVQSSPTLPTGNTPPAVPNDRAPSPDPSSLSSAEAASKVKISGPLNGTPIPAGYKFGARDTPPEPTSNSDRDRKAKSTNFWRFGRGEKAHPAAAGGVGAGPSRAVFAVSISEALSVAQIANLPAVAFRCIQYLEAKKADQEEGIYRLSGSSAVIKSLKDRFNAEGDVDLLASDEFWDPHAIAGLLKSFLRELPTSILTRDLHLRFLAVIDLADPQERVNELAQLISQLPLPNYSLLRALTAHLILIVQNASVNKMTMRNVGIVFSPTLGIPAGVFSLMLGEFNRVFNVDGNAMDTDDTPSTDFEQDAAKLKRISNQNNRNSRSYADGAADQMLGLAGRSLKPIGDESDSTDDMTIPDSSSGTETEDADVTATYNKSTGDLATGPLASDHRERVNSTPHADTPKRQPAKAASVAATRGLHIATDRRRSGAPGLPHSPRPVGKSTPPLAPFITGSVPNTPR